MKEAFCPERFTNTFRQVFLFKHFSRFYVLNKTCFSLATIPTKVKSACRPTRQVEFCASRLGIFAAAVLETNSTDTTAGGDGSAGFFHPAAEKGPPIKPGQ